MLDPKLKRKVQKIVDNQKSIELASLDATLELGDKLDELKTAIENIPETIIPEYPDFPEIPEPQEIIFPDVQKVEVINHTDDKEVKKLLTELVAEVKKKESYAYDIEIDASLKEQLKGEQGDKGEPGKDGVEIDASTIAEKLESLVGDDRLKMSAIKDLEDTIATLQNRTQLLNQIATTRNTGSSSSSSDYILTSPDGTRWQLSVGNDGVLTTTSL